MWCSIHLLHMMEHHMYTCNETCMYACIMTQCMWSHCAGGKQGTCGRKLGCYNLVMTWLQPSTCYKVTSNMVTFKIMFVA